MLDHYTTAPVCARMLFSSSGASRMIPDKRLSVKSLNTNFPRFLVFLKEASALPHTYSFAQARIEQGGTHFRPVGIMKMA